ncbi:hypothetical protein ABT115_18810 [Streptomyces sp. NPDC001832]|uniref:hypothetical protein n=1 Tax=Streptomyces sp. NPDC001832 TaxID=3154527 RepID=UPI0033225E66
MLDHLFTVASEDVPPAEVAISTQRGSTRYSQPSLTELLDLVRQSQGPAASQNWTNLEFEAAAGDEFRVRISIDLKRTEIDVSGSDERWVLGQAARLKNIVPETGGYTPGSRKGGSAFWLLGLGLAYLLVAILASLGFSADKDVKLPDVWGLALFLLSLGGLIAWIRDRARRPLLLVTSDVPTGSWWSRLSSNERIGAVSAAAAVVAAVAAVAALTK